jgi:hypothetical protein
LADRGIGVEPQNARWLSDAGEAQSATAHERRAARASDGHWRRRRVTFGVGYSGAPRRQHPSIAGGGSVSGVPNWAAGDGASQHYYRVRTGTKIGIGP